MRGMTLTFEGEDETGKVKVVYPKGKPNNFEMASQVVVIGRLPRRRVLCRGYAGEAPQQVSGHGDHAGGGEQMLLGHLVVRLGCAFALGAVVAYALSGRKPHLIRWGRGLFWGAFLMIPATEAVLQCALITGRYDLQYVFSPVSGACTCGTRLRAQGRTGRSFPAVGNLDGHLRLVLMRTCRGL